MVVPAKNRFGELIFITPDFRVSVQGEKDGGIHFIIHPNGHSGETLDFVVTDNEIKKLNE